LNEHQNKKSDHYRKPESRVVIWRGLPGRSLHQLLWFVGLSICIHVFLLILALFFGHETPCSPGQPGCGKKDPVRVTFQERHDSALNSQVNKNVVETKQQPTAPPKTPSALGQQDHIAEKETKTKPSLAQEKAQDYGDKSGYTKQANQVKPSRPKASEDPAESKARYQQGELAMQNKLKNAKEPYKELLPDAKELQQTMRSSAGGARENVSREIAIGDKIDLSTTNYRYIGYFTGLRKAIELAWSYPEEAVRRGYEGDVLLEFGIDRKGKLVVIKVLKSSGYPVLDRTIVDAIRSAAPFAPLPVGFGKEVLTVTATFRYTLSGSSGY